MCTSDLWDVTCNKRPVLKFFYKYPKKCVEEKTCLDINLADFKLKPASMLFLYAAAVWDFVVSVATVSSISPVNIVNHAATFILINNNNTA